MAESKVRLKLLIDTKSERVLFAEAEKDFVDFVFHILAMPLATVIRLLGKQEMVGCLGNLYDSVENFNSKYVLKGKDKEVFLKPKTPNPIASAPLAMLTDKPTDKTYYICSSCSHSYNGYSYSTTSYYSDQPNTPCGRCSTSMTRALTYVAPPLKKGEPTESGFVSDVATYMVTDDLVVTPLSSISSIVLLNKYNVKELGALQEKEIDFGMNEAVKLLKASLYTSSVLTTVFLNDECDQSNVPVSTKLEVD